MTKEKPNLEINGEKIYFDSSEEIQFWHWCEDMKEIGLIDNFTYHPDALELSPAYPAAWTYDTKGKVGKTLLKPHVYSPDFIIDINQAFIDKLGLKLIKKYFYVDDIANLPAKVYIDVKGTFNNHSGDRILSLNRKWVYRVHKVYINKVVPKDLFKDTFVPERELVSPKRGKPRTMFDGFPLLKDFIAK